MRWTDRQARIERAKEIGRLAYRLMIGQDVCGVVTVDQQEKHLRAYERGSLAVQFYEPFRAHALPTEFSRIVIRYSGRRVFEIRWTEARDFKALAFEPDAEWEEALKAESEANWF